MLLGSVGLKALRDLRRSLVAWSVGLAAYVAMLASVWPTIRDNRELKRLIESYPEALKSFFGFGGGLDFGTAAGYMGGELFSFMAPLLLTIATIGAGARAVAGEEERGTLDLVLSLPLSRQRFLAEKLGALVAEAALLGAALWLSLWLAALAVSMDIAAGKLAATVLVTVLFAVLFGTVALLVGTATGSRSLAVGVAAGLAGASYLVSSLAAIVQALEPARAVSPFYWYSAGDPLRRGLDALHPSLLVATTAAAAALALLVFARRDLQA